MNDENQTNIDQSQAGAIPVQTLPVVPVQEVPTVPVAVEAPVQEAPTVPVAVETPVQEAPTVPIAVETPVQEAPTVPVAVETPVQEAPTVPVPVETPVQEATPVETQKKDSGSGPLIIAVLLLLAAIAFVVFMPYLPFFKDPADNNQNNSSNNSENNASNKDDSNEDNSPNNEKKENNASDYVGVFTNTQGNSYIFTKDGKTLEISIEIGDYYYGAYGEIKGDKININLTKDKTTITFSEDKKSMTVKSDIKEINNQTFTKTSDYTKEDYVIHNFGETTFLKSKYSGKFTSNKNVLYTYQISEKEVKVVSVDNKSLFDVTFNIQDDGTLYSKLFDDEYKLIYNENKIIFATISGEKNLDGTYIKDRDLTLDDIVNNFS